MPALSLFCILTEPNPESNRPVGLNLVLIYFLGLNQKAMNLLANNSPEKLRPHYLYDPESFLMTLLNISMGHTPINGLSINRRGSFQLVSFIQFNGGPEVLNAVPIIFSPIGFFKLVLTIKNICSITTEPDRHQEIFNTNIIPFFHVSRKLSHCLRFNQTINILFRS